MIIGKYVRCPIDELHTENFRDFIIGKVFDYDPILETVSVKFYDIYGMNIYFDHIPKVETYPVNLVDYCDIFPKSLAIYKDEFACKIISKVKSDNKFTHYYIEDISKNKGQILKASEKDLLVQYDDGDYSPLKQLMNYEIQNPIWYYGRKNISNIKHVIENSSKGIELLLGSRVYLFEHQINTILKGINQKKCRLMLADEVGLGKTIQACIIAKGLEEKKEDFKSLFVIPSSLINQWKTELSYKFWIEVDIWDGDSSINQDITLVKLEDIAYFMELYDFEEYDLLVVDEVHRVLKDKYLYEKIHKLSSKIEHVLLLSATPIESRVTEYVNLLKLLHPQKYGDLTKEKFKENIHNSREIKEELYFLISDLEDYYEYDLGETYIEDLKALNEILNDSELEKLIDDIDLNSEDKGLNDIKIILAYITNNYEYEKDIVRNRRLEIREKLANRSSETITYNMSDSLYNFPEREVYDYLIEVLKDVEDFEFKKKFLSSFFSSPWALNKVILDNKKYLNNEQAERLYDLNQEWLNKVQLELSNHEYYEANPDEIRGRLMLAIDYLDENFLDEKVVIFTDWTETAEILEKYLKKKTSEEEVVGFYKSIDSETREYNVDKFQSLNKCRYLICDKLGGEGRNFQHADAIFHIDVPWNAIDVEQRIGRLDRIGREVDRYVHSISIVSSDTVEESLYNLWGEDGLNIYNESLSGLEIALEDIEKEIYLSLDFDLEFGLKGASDRLSNIIKNIKSQVDKERYFDYAKSLDPYKNKRIKKILNELDNSKTDVLEKSMIFWSNLVGLKPKTELVKNKDLFETIYTFSENDFSINSAKKTLFKNPDTKKALRRSKRKNTLTGTFSTDLAVKREDLIYFSPGDEIYDDIIRNAYKSYRGRSSAFALKSEIDWIGLIFTWNIHFNPNYLLEKGVRPSGIFEYKDFLPLNQYVDYFPLTNFSKDVDIEKVRQVYESSILNEEYHKYNVVHFGKRSRESNGYKSILKYESNIEYFKSILDKSQWQKMIENRYELSLKNVKENIFNHIEYNRAKQTFSENLIKSITNSQLELDIEELEFEKDLILKGLENPIIDLDSLVYIEFLKDE